MTDCEISSVNCTEPAGAAATAWQSDKALLTSLTKALVIAKAPKTESVAGAAAAAAPQKGCAAMQAGSGG